MLTLNDSCPFRTILHSLRDASASPPERHTRIAGTTAPLGGVKVHSRPSALLRISDLFPKWAKYLPPRGWRDVPSSNQGENPSQLTERERSSEEDKAVSMKEPRGGAEQGAARCCVTFFGRFERVYICVIMLSVKCDQAHSAVSVS